ncbi:DNA/RNA nuclease SfsA [Methyloligella sp. 2.7D]|uniref:DNA/RNA nuclease SfsA n=1 Tax=unclassified Methyloligella TaxID=2625955 RepID=UPI00157DF70D|nr:DNA/RNA nuclease SfsA [Methyloligella sp. GL2]QKP77823.1 DNA/RNA nuclease SfsA [Methyloligella sp. GL2]
MLVSFSSPLIEGTLLRRYKRFLADIELNTGEIVTAHCCNPGAMLGLNAEGAKVWLSKSNNPARKLRYSWELVEVDLGDGPALVGINTAHPNRAAEAAIAAGLIPALAGYDEMKREVSYGTGSRIDILLRSEDKPPCYVEVKNVHLMRKSGLAEFPDSVTSRGAKHLRELANVVDAGGRGVMLFLIQRDDAQSFDIARDIDPTYAAAFETARAQGVEVFAIACPMSLKGIGRPRAVPVSEPPARSNRLSAVAQGEITP